jgi:hypothetical protein
MMGRNSERYGRGVGGRTHQTGEISRRAVVAGALATSAVVAVVPLANAVVAEPLDPNSPQDMMEFLVLSAALTGVNLQTLAPEIEIDKSEILNSKPEVDPINIKNAYFRWITGHDLTSSFGKLLQIARDNRLSSDAIIRKVSGSDDNTKFLARSIVLLWYLGSWYEPGDLKNEPDSPHHQVVSSKAYTQGLVWQMAGAHPMGYSNLQFGYWSRDPHDPSSPGLFTPAKP